LPVVFVIVVAFRIAIYCCCYSCCSCCCRLLRTSLTTGRKRKIRERARLENQGTKWNDDVDDGQSDGRSVGHQNECGNARRAESLLNNCSSSSNNSLLRSPSCALPLLLAPRFSCGCGSGSGSEAQHAFFSCFLDYFFCLFNFSALALP